MIKFCLNQQIPAVEVEPEGLSGFREWPHRFSPDKAQLVHTTDLGSLQGLVVPLYSDTTT